MDFRPFRRRFGCTSPMMPDRPSNWNKFEMFSAPGQFESVRSAPCSPSVSGSLLCRSSLGLRHGVACVMIPGLERPPRFRWQRSGVAPARSGGLPASKLNVAPRATSRLPITSRHSGGDANGDGEGYVCLSRTRHRRRRISATGERCSWTRNVPKNTSRSGLSCENPNRNSRSVIVPLLHA
jgi:hypothetical protein